MAQFKLQINGRSHEVDVDADTPLLWVLRDHLGLVGTKYGCGIAQCGACTVHMNGQAKKDSSRQCKVLFRSIPYHCTQIESKHHDRPRESGIAEIDHSQGGQQAAGRKCRTVGRGDFAHRTAGLTGNSQNVFPFRL